MARFESGEAGRHRTAAAAIAEAERLAHSRFYVWQAEDGKYDWTTVPGPFVGWELVHTGCPVVPSTGETT